MANPPARIRQRRVPKFGIYVKCRPSRFSAPLDGQAAQPFRRAFAARPAASTLRNRARRWPAQRASGTTLAILLQVILAECGLVRVDQPDALSALCFML